METEKDDAGARGTLGGSGAETEAEDDTLT